MGMRADERREHMCVTRNVGYMYDRAGEAGHVAGEESCMYSMDSGLTGQSLS